MKRKATAQSIDISLSDLEDSRTEEAVVVVEKFSADRRRILQCHHDSIWLSPSKSNSPPPEDVVIHDLSNIEPGIIGSSTQQGIKPRTRRVLLSVCPPFPPIDVSLTTHLKDEPLKDWMPHRDEYLEELFWHDGRAGASSLCPSCVQSAPCTAEYACKDCLAGQLLCADCIVRRHVENPFHRIRVGFAPSRSRHESLTCPATAVARCMLGTSQSSFYWPAGSTRTSSRPALHTPSSWPFEDGSRSFKRDPRRRHRFLWLLNNSRQPSSTIDAFETLSCYCTETQDVCHLHSTRDTPYSECASEMRRVRFVYELGTVVR